MAKTGLQRALSNVPIASLYCPLPVRQVTGPQWSHAQCQQGLVCFVLIVSECNVDQTGTYRVTRLVY